MDSPNKGEVMYKLLHFMTSSWSHPDLKRIISTVSLLYWGLNKIAASVEDKRFECILWKCMDFSYDFTEVCSWGSNQRYSRIDSGSVPTRRQAIIWTNDGLAYWHIYASLGLNELLVQNDLVSFQSVQNEPHFFIFCHCMLTWRV